MESKLTKSIQGWPQPSPSLFYITSSLSMKMIEWKQTSRQEQITTILSDYEHEYSINYNWDWHEQSKQVGWETQCQEIQNYTMDYSHVKSS